MLTKRDPATRTLATDYGAAQFENKNLLLFELFRNRFERSGDPVIRGVTFRNCQIDGPAVLLPLSGCHFADSNFGYAKGDMRTLVLYPASTESVTGAIAMVDCVFESVDFFSIGFTGHTEFINSLLAIETRK